MRTRLAILALLSTACSGGDEAARGAGCAAYAADPDSPRAVCVSDPWVRPAAQGATATAAYFTVSATLAEFEVRGARADGFEAVELHRSLTEGGMMRMEPVSAVVVPADGSVSFEPGGFHVMLIGPDAALAEGDAVEITLDMSLGGPLTFTAPVRRGGPDGGGGHAGH